MPAMINKLLNGENPPMKAWFNGTIIDEHDIAVSPLSHSFSRGTAIFEVLEIVESHRGPALFGLGEHINRLYRSAEFLYMPLNEKIAPEALSDAVRALVRTNNLKRGIIKIFAYYSTPEYSCIPSNRTVSLAIFCTPFNFSATNKQVYTAQISRYRKNHPESVPVHAKAAGYYVNFYLALMEASSRGFDEAILLDTMGFVAEGGTSNIFVVKDGILMTPTVRSILPGITRKFILEITSNFMECIEKDITQDELLSADEVFFSNSVERIMPIYRIGDRDISTSSPGSYTVKIMNAINDVIAGQHPAYVRWLSPVV